MLYVSDLCAASALPSALSSKGQSVAIMGALTLYYTLTQVISIVIIRCMILLEYFLILRELNIEHCKLDSAHRRLQLPLHSLGQLYFKCMAELPMKTGFKAQWFYCLDRYSMNNKQFSHSPYNMRLILHSMRKVCVFMNNSWTG